MLWGGEYRFLRLLENIEIDNKQEDARSDIKINEYSEKIVEKAIKINRIIRYYSIKIKIKRKVKREIKEQEHWIK